jgi:Pro-kumamolisin, activation domain/Bacterial Ig-like domain (group 3)
MIKLRSLPLHIPLCILASTFLLPAISQGQGIEPTVRIVNRIDEAQRVTLRGNTHPFANAAHDQGKVADNLLMTDLILVLSRDPAQQAAFDAYVASEYDQNSPNYHQWLTPDQIGEQFGPSQTDIQTITNWLTGHGFTVSQVTRDRMSIRFGGTAAQVQSAFHTEIHNLTVKGEAHIANMSDPQIPASLSNVVIGVKALHNFFPKPLHRMGQTVQRDAQSGKWARQAPVGALSTPEASSATSSSIADPSSTLRIPSTLANSRSATPQFGVSVTGAYPYLVEDVGPWDFATIYNITPLWNAGIDGTGQTIAIAGTSDIDVGQSTTETGANGYNDVNTFRTFFNLPTGNSWNTPIRVSGNSHALQVCTDTTGSQPCGIDDLLENSLDVEWSASIAKNAQVVLVASYPTSTTDDNLYDSESYIVDNVGNSSSPVYGVHVMNVSYGECELALGTAGNVQYYDLWQTAAAEGLAVIVAAGDSGSASCDDGGYVAESGLSVSGLASTPWNTAVGGTDFNWCAPQNFFNSPSTQCTAAPHWNTTNSSNQSTAAGYVPEVPWNDTCANPLALTWEQDIASEIFGYSTTTINSPEQACNFIYDYSFTVSGGTAGLGYYYPYAEYLVNVVGGSGGASSCVLNTTSPTGTSLGTCTTGQTSTGVTTNPDTSASQAALTITTTDGWPKPSWQTGVTGIPNDGVRDLPDVSFFAADGFLSSSAYLICVSQDSSAYGTSQACNYQSNQEPVAQEVGGTSVATPAMAGIVALINQKSGAAQGSPNAQLYALAAKQTYSSCSAESVSASSTTCYFNDIDQYTIAQPCDAVDHSPNCTATQSTLGYSDQIGIASGYTATTGFDLATGLGSMNIANVVNAWTKVTPGPTTPTVTVTPSPTSINSNNTLSVTVTIAGGTGAPKDGGGHTVVPTGTVTLTASGSTYTATNTVNTSGSYTFTVPANSLPGTSGGQSDTLSANYAGDVNYAAKAGTGTVTVTTSTTSLLTPTITPSPTSQSVNSEGSFTEKVTVSGSGIIPTGTVTLTSGSYNSGAQALVNGTYTFTVGSANTQSPLAAGTDTMTISYSGDSNYSPGTPAMATVTVTESTFTLTPGTPSSSSVTPGQSATVTITAAPTAGYTGTLTLTCAQTSTTATGGDGTTCNPSGSDLINLATCGASCSVTFTIGTTAPIVARLERPAAPGGRNLLGAGSGAILALLVFFGIPARRRSWRSMLSILLVMAAIGTLASCGGGTANGGGGGGGQSDPGTTAGTYTYTVTASASPSVTPTVTKTFTVTVN